ncbi:MAG: nucleoside hydrolase [Nitrososphaeria archaeon]
MGGSSKALDMDPGIDDACAIILSESFWGSRLRSVSTVSGNVDVQKTTINALRIKELFGYSYKVYRGASRPLAGRLTKAAFVHGNDGLGDAGLPMPQIKEEKQTAVEALIRAAADGHDIIATGPLTNVALLLILRPDLTNNIGSLTIMGGAFRLTETGGGNATRFAEFNVYADPEAADIVFSSLRHMNVVPLDLTMNPALSFRKDEIEGLPDTKGARFLRAISARYLERFPALVLHDAIAVDVLEHDDEYTYMSGRVGVVKQGIARGATYLMRDDEYDHRVYIAPKNNNGFKERFLSALKELS